MAALATTGLDHDFHADGHVGGERLAGQGPPRAYAPVDGPAAEAHSKTWAMFAALARSAWIAIFDVR
jgi:hypothetical protein